MTIWEKPSFEELAMNAEIGAYQPDDWDGERQYVPFVKSDAQSQVKVSPVELRIAPQLAVPNG